MKEHEQYISVIKFPAFVSLSLIILSLIYAAFLGNAYRQTGLSVWESVLFSLIFAILFFLVCCWILTLRSTHIKIHSRWLQRFSKWMLNFVYYNMGKALSYLTLSSKITFGESFLNFNNETVLTDQRDVTNSNILVLLPHCLQKADCPVRITSDIIKCEECGGCDIARIKQLVTAHDVFAAVASGGSLARKLIKDHHPDVIVAVACHRDLVEGVRDAWMFPIYAVLNERPKGPCFETTVSLATIEFAINRFK